MNLTKKRLLILFIVIIFGAVLGRLAVRAGLNLLLGGTLFGGNICENTENGDCSILLRFLRLLSLCFTQNKQRPDHGKYNTRWDERSARHTPICLMERVPPTSLIFMYRLTKVRMHTVLCLSSRRWIYRRRQSR